MRHKVWVYNPYKQEKTISDQAKLRVQVRCDQFVLKYLRPRLARPFDSKNKKEAQCIDVQWKWYRHYIHFKAIYKDLRLDTMKEIYEYPIARLEYMDENLFHLSYFRHTGKWSKLTYSEGNSLDECLKLIKELPHFGVA